ncbi:MAG: M48 family metallopeptidase [Defluviitaleaceae bacterium]|nr:M48 family metallopeptidase [Defluviitaleaceae bacterium]
MAVINPREYYHEQDKRTLDELTAIPGFTPLLKAFMKVFNEKLLHNVNMANKLRLGPKQLPNIYNMLPPICEKLGIDEPELYVEMNPIPNAYTYGDTQAFITITSGLLDCMTEDEVKTVLAHECGHIACRHVLYHTMASLILSGASGLVGLNILSIGLQFALLHWNRCSEFSCDRAAAVYMQDSKPVISTMMRLAGGGTKNLIDSMNLGLFMKQADDYSEHIGNSSFNKLLHYYLVKDASHPFLTIRASEIRKWCKTEQFHRIINYSEGKEDVLCPDCKTLMVDTWKFCRSCGYSV